MNFKIFMFVGLSLFFSIPSPAFTVGNGKLIEDFTTLTAADFNATTGIWNSGSHVAQAGAVSGGSLARSISFGNGSDGALNLSSGSYTFDTDAHPTGYNFTSLLIGSGVTLAVQGSQPLIIRSLSTLQIAATLSANGRSVAHDSALAGTGHSSLTGPAGATPRACLGTGGGGGSNPTTLTSAIGLNGIMATGASENNHGAVASDGAPAASGPVSSALFDSTGFFCGTGGGGGGSFANGAGNFATGASGGAGGGAIRISAVGNLSLNSITANGGIGGDAGFDGACAGNGGAGSGGSIWLQSLATVSANPIPTVASGDTGGIGASHCAVGSTPSFAGVIRCDSAPSSRPVCDVVNDMNTNLASPGAQTYVVQSTGYDLGVVNALFTTPSVASSTSGGGSAATAYAASADNITFTGFTGDLTTLSNQNYRYVKFKVTIMTATASAVSPTVSQIQIPFTEGGKTPLSGALGFGCGSTSRDRFEKSTRGASSSLLSVFWFAVFTLIYGLVRNTRLVPITGLPNMSTPPILKE